ncbi:hypothetical protein AX17_003384 [Amanita inopinata Kibby_2008]|nr:hypothetical protein AX17_003384 [Amanita inopinata Kibby_2008]
MESGNAPAIHFCSLLNEMTNSLSSARQVVKSLQQDEAALDTKDGISLLSLKHHLLLLYLRSLLLVSSRRAAGHSLSLRARTSTLIGAQDRACRENGAGDLVDFMVECRVILEKMKVLESRIRYQIEKLIRLAREPTKSQNIADDPLAFRPNLENLVVEHSDAELSSEETADAVTDKQHLADGIYRPPRLAPMPYLDQSKNSRKDRNPVPSGLRVLLNDHTRPHMESTSGLGSTPAASGRVAYLQRLKEFEEENFSRLVMKKSEAKKRARDEAEVALGGRLNASEGRARKSVGGLEDEFGDVLKTIERADKRTGANAVDGYEELRKKGRKRSVLDRSRTAEEPRKRYAGLDNELGNGERRKRTRFELETKIAQKRRKRGM